MTFFWEITEGDESVTLINLHTTKSITLIPQGNGKGLRLIIDRCGDKLFHWHEYGNIISSMVTYLYEFDEKRGLPKGKESCPPPKRLAWNLKRQIKYLSGTISKHWKRISEIEKYKKYVLFNKKLCNVIGLKHDWNDVKSYYDDNHIVWNDQFVYNDAINYKPCMMLIARKLYDSVNKCWSPYEDSLETFQDWKQCFAYGGNTYKALNKTLLNVKYSIPIHKLINLSRLKLEKPILTRAELCTALATTECYPPVREDIQKIIINASEKEIKKAFRYYKKVNNETYNLKKSRGYAVFVSYLKDYAGENYYGDILGLTKRSIAYHEQLRQNRVKVKATVPLDTKTAIPPFKYDSIKGVKLLETAGEVISEGEIMGHCVGTYAKSAIKGYCYLFHVEYAKQKATVEIVPNGQKGIGTSPYYIGQAQGPGNKPNKATAYAMKEFNKLFKKLVTK